MHNLEKKNHIFTRSQKHLGVNQSLRVAHKHINANDSEFWSI